MSNFVVGVNNVWFFYCFDYFSLCFAHSCETLPNYIGMIYLAICVYLKYGS